MYFDLDTIVAFIISDFDTIVALIISIPFIGFGISLIRRILSVGFYEPPAKKLSEKKLIDIPTLHK